MPIRSPRLVVLLVFMGQWPVICSRCASFGVRLQQPEAIPNDHQGGSHIGSNRHPEGGYACCCQPDEEQFHPQGEDNVLLDHGERAPGISCFPLHTLWLPQDVCCGTALGATSGAWVMSSA